MYINTTENVLADALSRAVSESLIMLDEYFLVELKNMLNLKRVI